MSNDIKKLNRTQFGQNAEKYVTSKLHAQGTSLQRMVSLTDPRPGWRVLDIATGGGHTALTFSAHCQLVVATDLTYPMLVAARSHILVKGTSNAQFVQHDAEALPFPHHIFDCVTCRIAPHHFSNPAKFVTESARVLKPGGVLAVTDNLVSGEPAIAMFVNTLEKLRDPSHNWAYALADWETFFFSAGLQIEHTETLAKEVNFDRWAARMNVADKDRIRLRALLVQAPLAPRQWLQVKQTGPLITFMLREGLIIGRKPAA